MLYLAYPFVVLAALSTWLATDEPAAFSAVCFTFGALILIIKDANEPAR